MDLEDAVAPASKAEARDAARSVIAGDTFDPERFVLRVNAPLSDEGGRDLAMLAGARDALAGHALTVLVPKVCAPTDLEPVRMRIEGLGARPALVPIVETAEGLANAEALANADAVEGLLFGGLDLSLDLGAELDWEALLYARSRLIHVARLGRVWALDMPFLDVSDEAGLRLAAERARRLGFKGKAAIHPTQVGPIHDTLVQSVDAREDVELGR